MKNNQPKEKFKEMENCDNKINLSKFFFLYICTISKLILKKNSTHQNLSKVHLGIGNSTDYVWKKINNTKTKKIISSNIRIRELVNWKHLYYNYYHYFFNHQSIFNWLI